ncbi:unnamed protein product [Mytilus coruscus]|uniref:Uncharacterized protein n=1 Tax=Mytilus coruscus TaxID=42192 RepID=A0A6J8BKG7_MYTCO|nr:unnamed protein product [Mytilus coruscus]
MAYVFDGRKVAPEDSGDKDTLKGRMSQIKINKDMTSERNMMDFFLENEEDLEDSTPTPQRQQQCCNAPNIVQMDEHTEQCQNAVHNPPSCDLSIINQGSRRPLAMFRLRGRRLKDNVKDIDDLEAELGAIQKALEAEKKRFDHIEKYMAKCLPMVGGKMEGDIDMQGHAIHNLPEGTRADEPVTKGWYAKNWQDLVVSMQGKINALEGKVKSYHTADRSKRDLGLEDELESDRVKPPPSTEDEIVVTGFSLLP